MIVLLLAAVGFAAPDVDGPQAVDVPAPVVAHDHTTFSLLEVESVAQGVDRALASRREIPCDQVLDLGSTADVRTALAAATERELPPWAPLRAASCLTDLAETDDVALAYVQQLVARTDAPGFALAVTERLDHLPELRAVSIAQVAVANPSPALRSRLPARLRESSYSTVRALVPSR